MIYYESRYLSERLSVNLARWKRWSREFLEPDPLGGMQSGVARQFSSQDAFKVFLGGVMVGELKFTIPEAVRILSDLSPWLRKKGFFSIASQLRPSEQNNLQEHHIYIFAVSRSHFAYAVRTLVPSPSQDHGNGPVSETYTLSLLGTDADPLQAGTCSSAKVVAITTLYRKFRQQID